MAELSTVARPYAEALFSAAQGAKAADAWQAPLDRLAALVGNAQVAEVVADPKLQATQVVSLIEGLAGGTLPDGVQNLLRLLVENDRLATLPEISRQYRILKNQADGVADCLVESAFPLEQPELDSLLAALRRRFPLQLRPEVRVDPSLIGGVRVTVGDQVLDTTVRTRLDQMRTALTA
ncbi:MAG TPA: F0F1 ATP synthase subunit delta [Burkholderiaceae bacterium]|nr:F0F1 ATP synthase subunit delta [Burkholderiaceae bacterium]